MADSTIDSEGITLLDLFPGVPRDVHQETDAKGGFTDSATHNVETAKYPIGTKIQIQNTGAGKEGPSIFMYGQVGTQNPDVAIAAKSVCTFDSTSNPFKLTNDSAGDISTRSCPAAVALSAMTNDYYGWFWVGGVCPEGLVSDLGGTYATDGTVAAGAMCVGALAASDVPLGFSATVDGSTADTTAAQSPADVACGFALTADA